MSLGVLNNLSAVYAENNLTNTNNSLSKTLQQLSSGSRINSGADDAAGLSLVDGLQANQTALTQSETNATEGVGLLQVADGALSQVTSLLNRAVTLATEASNGTLNSSQDTAANQEYQSILSEISNIGSTTTYNNQAVFNSNTNIYTGDSSTTGSSIDALNIHSLSSSNVGDTNGAMAYSSDSGNVFYNLSNGTTQNASASDTLGATTATTVTVTTESNSITGPVATSHTISVGVGSTVNDLISAINNSGLGLTASFTTAGAAGVAADTTAAQKEETGIEITGGGTIGVGISTGQIGTVSETTGDEADMGGTLSVVGANGKTSVFTANAGSDTTGLSGLAAQINAAKIGVTASFATGAPDTLVLTSTNSGVEVFSALTTSSGATAYAPSASFYTTGINSSSASAATGVFDQTTQSASTGVTASGQAGAGGTATISYADAAGQSLSGTDLSNQTDAQTALTSLNAAITDVAAQDGYVGAQINTLNAVSQVLSTQQENVQSAQNAVQATDYASASSNMSKYEILSQTGISALAQANSVQQEVTKLLQ